MLPRNVKSNGSWPFLAQAPVALRANNVRPYDYTFADGLYGGVNERRKSGYEKKDVLFKHVLRLFFHSQPISSCTSVPPITAVANVAAMTGRAR